MAKLHGGNKSSLALAERARYVNKEGEEAGEGWDKENPWAESAVMWSAAEVLGWDLQDKQTWSAAEENLNRGVVRTE